ncbi:DUF2156 domain-containing protein [candidate division WWE3 bacterium]|uniref:DUF2156 domain-containing protein n=1 Tax=candidate division WWE3 bacterium TaxID=2053526 RepID=A0A955LK94_UNCKA|nr:DUF2156 domain-containing protein [candidate division WWE3 bacterium]
MDYMDVSEFPNFMPLSLGHKELVNRFNGKHDSNHSATNFTNLFILDNDNDTEISSYKDALVFKQTELGTERTNYLLIAPTNDEAALVKDLIGKHISPIVLYPHPILNYEPDEDNSDYIYSIANTIKLEGSQYANIRRKIGQFKKEHNAKLTKVADAERNEIWDFAHELFVKNAAAVDELTRQSLIIELDALEKTIMFADKLDVDFLQLTEGDRILGFVVTEVIAKETVLIHFFRTNNEVKGVSEYLFVEMARFHKAQKLIDFEQDLGIVGLRRFKSSLQPYSKLSVYSINDY